MNQFNFLPDVIVEKRNNREKRQWLIGGLAICTAVLIAGIIGILFSVNGISNTTETVQDQLDKAKTLSEKLQKVKADITLLRNKNTRLSNLREALPARVVISHIINKMPQKVSLTKISWETPKFSDKSDDKKANSKRSRKSKEPEVIQIPPSKLIITGIAKSDIDAAHFVGELSGHDLFDLVKLVNSREIIINDAKLYEFYITASVFTNREFLALTETEVTP